MRHVITYEIGYGYDGYSELYKFKDKAEAVLEESGLGEYDGHEIRVDWNDTLAFIYGYDPE